VDGFSFVAREHVAVGSMGAGQFGSARGSNAPESGTFIGGAGVDGFVGGGQSGMFRGGDVRARYVSTALAAGGAGALQAARDGRRLGPMQLVGQLDLQSCSVAESQHLGSRAADPLPFTATSDGVCHGFCLWFDVTFVGGAQPVVLSTSPISPPTHWQQSVVFLPETLLASPGASLAAKIIVAPAPVNPRWSTVSIEMGVVDDDEEEGDDQGGAAGARMAVDEAGRRQAIAAIVQAMVGDDDDAAMQAIRDAHAVQDAAMQENGGQ